MKIHIFSVLAASFSIATGLIADPEDRSPLLEIECGLIPIDREEIHRGEKFTAINNIQNMSGNWCGYVAGASLDQSAPHTVEYAAGSWVVPTLLPTPDDSYCAIWVGIDGYLSSTVEQIGTSHNWVNGMQENYAWFEMYPSGAYEISGFPVDIGDQISVRIAYKGNNIFKLVMFNHTKGLSTTIPSSFTITSKPLRNTAEWIIETPSSQGILHLSDFKLATFNYCSANINGVNGTITHSTWINKPIVMEKTDGTVQAEPSDVIKKGDCFIVTWKSE